MSDNWVGGNTTATTSWFTAGNWSTGTVPVISATGTQSVVINGSAANQPVISPNAAPYEIEVQQALNTGGAGYTVLEETQIGGEFITLTNNANLTIQGVALGVFYGNTPTLTASGATMTGLHGALTATPTADTHMQISVLGADTLTVDTVNENFGLITIGNHDTLTINNIETGGNAQQLHGLINYGEISVSAGGELIITAQAPTGTTVANFYNAGWIVDNGGTVSISSSVLDGASTLAAAGGVDGFIELGNSALAILSGSVSSAEQVDFTDGSNDTLQITAGTLFSGTVNNFGTGDTIVVNGFTSTSNATITNVGGATELITTNGTVLTTITLTGTIGTNITTGTNSSGQEIITGGGGTVASTTTYAGGTSTLSNGSGTLLNNGTVTVTGAGTELVVTSSVTGTGAFFIDYGATLALDNPTGNDAGQTVIFGTHGLSTAPNVLIINDDTLGFGGHVTGFGANDEIILGPNALTQPTAGSGILLNYSNGVLTVEDTSSSGAILSTENITIAGTGALSTGSFVALQSTAGEIIELASSQAGQSYVFSIASASTGSFETPANYVGGVAPGDILAPGETVTIASGTATVSTGGITDNGTISITSTMLDAHTLSGTGSIVIGTKGALTLANGGSVNSITDNNLMYLSGGTLAAPVTVANSAALSITGASDITGSLSGAGNVTVASGVFATLSGGSSVTTIRDNGTIDLSGSVSSAIAVSNGKTGTLVVDAGHTATLTGAVKVSSILDSGTIDIGSTAAISSINMMGNGAYSTVDFLTAAADTTPLTNFGTSDEIILGGSVLTTPGTSAVQLTYTGGTLTVKDTVSGTVSTAKITVGSVSGSAAFSNASFIALNGAAGEVIELVSSLPTQSFDFSIASGTSGAFEAGANFSGGVAPGDSLVTGENVTIGSGTASVSTAGVIDNGNITVASGAGFTDAGTLTGTGTLAIAGSATLTGTTSLTSITDAGSLTLSGTDAVAITLASGAQVTLAGNFADSAAINGAGTLTVNAGVTATLASGSSIASVLNAGTLDLAGSFGGSIDMHGNGAGTAVDFTGANVTNGTLNTAITDFGYGDKITLSTAAFALHNSGDVLSESYSNTGVLTVTDSTEHTSVSIDLGLAGSDPASYITVSGSTGQLVITLCFYPGTALATPAGEIKVEAIVAGDLLMTTNGAMPVRWIGQSHIHTAFADPLRSLPIRIRQGALGGGLPVRDLLLSPDHAIAIDGILVQASALVNGGTVIRDYDVPEQFTYYHVELDSHELLLAEGVEAESFVDNVDRMHFHNWEDRTAPDTAITEMDLPRAKSTRQLPMAIRRRLGLDKLAVA